MACPRNGPMGLTDWLNRHVHQTNQMLKPAYTLNFGVYTIWIRNSRTIFLPFWSWPCCIQKPKVKESFWPIVWWGAKRPGLAGLTESHVCGWWVTWPLTNMWCLFCCFLSSSSSCVVCTCGRSGDTDGRVPVIGSRYCIEALGLPLKSPWRSWYHNNQVRPM